MWRLHVAEDFHGNTDRFANDRNPAAAVKSRPLAGVSSSSMHIHGGMSTPMFTIVIANFVTILYLLVSMLKQVRDGILRVCVGVFFGFVYDCGFIFTNTRRAECL